MSPEKTPVIPIGTKYIVLRKESGGWSPAQKIELETNKEVHIFFEHGARRSDGRYSDDLFRKKYPMQIMRAANEEEIQTFHSLAETAQLQGQLHQCINALNLHELRGVADALSIHLDDYPR